MQIVKPQFTGHHYNDERIFYDWIKDQDVEIKRIIGARVILRSLPVVVSEAYSLHMAELGVELTSLLHHGLASAVIGIAGNLDIPLPPEVHLKRSELQHRASMQESARLTAIAQFVTCTLRGPESLLAGSGSIQLSGYASDLYVRPSAAAGALPAIGPTWVAMTADLKRLEEGGDLSQAPLWLTENTFAEDWTRARELLAHVDDGDFWIEWYQALLDGGLQDWNLLAGVASIHEAFWQAGPSVLAMRARDVRKQREFHPKAATQDDVIIAADKLAEACKEASVLFQKLREEVALSPALAEQQASAAIAGHNLAPDETTIAYDELMDTARDAITNVRAQTRALKPNHRMLEFGKRALRRVATYLKDRTIAAINEIAEEKIKDELILCLLRLAFFAAELLEKYESWGKTVNMV